MARVSIPRRVLLSLSPAPSLIAPRIIIVCLNSPKGPALFVTRGAGRRPSWPRNVSIPRRVLLSLSQPEPEPEPERQLSIVSIPRRVLLSLSLCCSRCNSRRHDMSQFPEGSCSLCHRRQNDDGCRKRVSQFPEGSCSLCHKKIFGVYSFFLCYWSQFPEGSCSLCHLSLFCWPSWLVERSQFPEGSCSLCHTVVTRVRTTLPTVSQFPEGSCSLCHDPTIGRCSEDVEVVSIPRRVLLSLSRGTGFRRIRTTMMSQFPEGSCSLCHLRSVQVVHLRCSRLNSPKGPALFVTGGWRRGQPYRNLRVSIPRRVLLSLSPIVHSVRPLFRDLSQFPEGSCSLCHHHKENGSGSWLGCLNSPKGPALFVTSGRDPNRARTCTTVSIPRRVLLSLSLLNDIRVEEDNRCVSIPRRVLLSLSRVLDVEDVTYTGEICLNSPKGPALFVTDRHADRQQRPQALVSIPRRVLLSLSHMSTKEKRPAHELSQFPEGSCSLCHHTTTEAGQVLAKVSQFPEGSCSLCHNPVSSVASGLD